MVVERVVATRQLPEVSGFVAHASQKTHGRARIASEAMQIACDSRMAGSFFDSRNVQNV